MHNDKVLSDVKIALRAAPVQFVNARDLLLCLHVRINKNFDRYLPHATVITIVNKKK